MILTLKKGTNQDTVLSILNQLTELGAKSKCVQLEGKMLVCIDAGKHVDLKPVINRREVLSAHPIGLPYKLVSRKFRPAATVIEVGHVKIGGGALTIISGPCAVESREQIMETARRVKANGAAILRGGVFKPRTSPYAFQGMGEEGLKLLKEAGKKYDMPVVTEILDEVAFDHVVDHVDMIQIGARNMQNFSLLKKAGNCRKPILLKRGPSATIEEFLLAAEYIMSNGNSNVILCERGIKTYEPMTRNTLDISCVPLIKHLSHLPILVDPSHASGDRKLIKALSLAAIAAGADGVMIEAHSNPDQALSDGPQSILPEGLKEIKEAMNRIAEVLAV